MIGPFPPWEIPLFFTDVEVLADVERDRRLKGAVDEILDALRDLTGKHDELVTKLEKEGFLSRDEHYLGVQIAQKVQLAKDYRKSKKNLRSDLGAVLRAFAKSGTSEQKADFLIDLDDFKKCETAWVGLLNALKRADKSGWRREKAAWERLKPLWGKPEKR